MANFVFFDVDLNFSCAILDMIEGGFAHSSEGEDSSCDAGFFCCFLFCIEGAVFLE